MGLSIHYSGSFNPSASLEGMIEEVVEIAKVYNWKYTVFETIFPQGEFDDKYDEKIYGITFTPPSCEPVFLTFLSNGRMSSSAHLKFFGNSSDKKKQKYLYMLSTKTQYAGIKTHMLIILLLKYLSNKYVQTFQLTDEGRYWETGDEKLLEDSFKRYNDLLNSVSDALETFPVKTGETMEEYLSRLLDCVNKKRLM
jgi:hypothetical protein